MQQELLLSPLYYALFSKRSESDSICILHCYFDNIAVEHIHSTMYVRVLGKRSCHPLETPADIYNFLCKMRICLLLCRDHTLQKSHYGMLLPLCLQNRTRCEILGIYPCSSSLSGIYLYLSGVFWTPPHAMRCTIPRKCIYHVLYRLTDTFCYLLFYNSLLYSVQLSVSGAG